MKWSTLSLEKVNQLEAKYKSYKFVFFGILSVAIIVFLTSGEPHIDGEPGDLRFRIKVLKYE